jgi:hypothetical protein
MTNLKISSKKAKLIKALETSDIVVGELVAVRYSAINNYIDPNKTYRNVNCKVMAINGNTYTVKDNGSDHSTNCDIDKSEILARDVYNIGANPFNDKFDSTRAIAYDLESIIFNLNIIVEDDYTKRQYFVGENKNVPALEVNWNPFIYNKNGEKEFYQRPFVWTLNDNRMLIESIYERIDCGKILVRNRSFIELEAMARKGDTVVYFKDIVDGKQRLNAVRGFIMGEFSDMHGNFYSDLSSSAQRKFTNHQLFSYSEIPENSKDDDILNQFLRLNFMGVPQSKEHIKFVKSLREKI